MPPAIQNPGGGPRARQKAAHKEDSPSSYHPLSNLLSKGQLRSGPGSVYSAALWIASSGLGEGREAVAWHSASPLPSAAPARPPAARTGHHPRRPYRSVILHPRRITMMSLGSVMDGRFLPRPSAGWIAIRNRPVGEGILRWCSGGMSVGPKRSAGLVCCAIGGTPGPAQMSQSWKALQSHRGPFLRSGTQRHGHQQLLPYQ
jgi:hypothetical protein